MASRTDDDSATHHKGRRLPRGWITIALLVALAAGWLVTFNLAGRRADIPVSDLLVDEPRFPGVRTSSVHGEQPWNAIVNDDFLDDHTGWLVRWWSPPVEDDKYYDVAMAVREASSPLGAWFWFRDALDAGYPISLGESPIGVGGLTLDDTSASEFALGCQVVHWVDGAGQVWCSAWVFAARYGQYELHITYFEDAGALSQREFAEIVQAIESAVSVRLDR